MKKKADFAIRPHYFKITKEIILNIDLEYILKFADTENPPEKLIKIAIKALKDEFVNKMNELVNEDILEYIAEEMEIEVFDYKQYIGNLESISNFPEYQYITNEEAERAIKWK
jgi:hypothetical protein